MWALAIPPDVSANLVFAASYLHLSRWTDDLHIDDQIEITKRAAGDVHWVYGLRPKAHRGRWRHGALEGIRTGHGKSVPCECEWILRRKNGPI